MSSKSTAGVLVPHKAERRDLWNQPPLLHSERAEDFDVLLNALTRDVEPRGVIEHLYVSDIAHLVWEIVRLRRCKTAILKMGYRSAIRAVLPQTITDPGEWVDLNLADKWFSSAKAKDEVRKSLARVQLDESAIEAEAVRQVSADLEKFDKMLMGLEARRDKALACIAGYRHSFARQLREGADKTIDQAASELPRVEDASVTTAAE